MLLQDISKHPLIVIHSPEKVVIEVPLQKYIPETSTMLEQSRALGPGGPIGPVAPVAPCVSNLK